MGLRSLYKFSPRVPYFLSFPYLWLTHNLAWSLLWGRLVQGPGEGQWWSHKRRGQKNEFLGTQQCTWGVQPGQTGDFCCHLGSPVTSGCLGNKGGYVTHWSHRVPFGATP